MLFSWENIHPPKVAEVILLWAGLNTCINSPKRSVRNRYGGGTV